MVITRVRIASVVGAAFAAGPVDKSELLSHAVAHQAEPDIIETLATLPEGRYDSLRGLWGHLENIPVGV